MIMSNNIIQEIEQLDIPELIKLRDNCVTIAEMVENKIQTKKKNENLFYV